MADQTNATHLEPLARKEIMRGDAALISIAVSLKRIADTLDKVVSSGNFHSLDNIAWQIGQTLGRGFEIGSRK